MANTTYDLVIIGGGPGGVAAGVYAARKQIKTVLITESFGGQSLVSADVQNWIGTKSISGYDLAKNLEEHVKSHEGIEIIEDDLVSTITKCDDGTFLLQTKNEKTVETKYILLATGASHRKLGVPGEKEFDGKGVFYCSICDAPVMKGKTAVVVGGGNAGLEAVIDLLPYAEKIYLLARSDALKGDPITQEKVKANPKVEIIYRATTTEIVGKDLVTGLRYTDASGASRELAVSGVFVEIGAVSNSGVVKDLVTLNERGEVVVDHKTMQSSNANIWAVGDVSDVLYKQNNISAGDAVKAILNIYDRLIKGA